MASSPWHVASSSENRRTPGGGDVPEGAQASGSMFWFIRKTFVGSYFALIRASRS